MAFGLGAGACFYYVALEDASPSRWFNGRVARLEENFRELTGAALEMRTFEERRREAWAAARTRSTTGAPPCCSPTSITSTTTAARPTSPATRSSSPATTTRSPISPTPGSRSCRRRGSRTCAGPPQQAPGVPARRATCSGSRRAVRDDGCARRCRRRSSGRRWRCSSPSWASSPACRRCSDSPPRRGVARRRRGLAVVRALRLPGDRAARHRRRQLPADVLALPRGGRYDGGAPGRRGGAALDRAGRRLPRRQRARRAEPGALVRRSASGGAALRGGRRAALDRRSPASASAQPAGSAGDVDATHIRVDSARAEAAEQGGATN